MIGDNKPLVSIIINCYNSDTYLKETLDSVLMQSYGNWEIIFWDNQSTDNSAEYFKSYNDSRFKYFYATSHTALSTARNLAVLKATGSYLAFLDCDDIWLPDKLSLQIDSLIKEDAGFVYSKFEVLICSDHTSIIEQTAQYNKLNDQCIPHDSKNLYNTLLLGNYIIFSSVVLKKKVFESTGGFKDNFSQNEDYEILLKASLISSAVCIDYIGVKYRIHGSNNSYLNGEKNFIENRAIFSSLPLSKELKEAKRRNNVKYGLFKIFKMKKANGLILLLDFSAPKFLFEIFVKRARYKFRKNAKL